MSDIITSDGLTRQQLIDRLVADDVRLMMKGAGANDFGFVAHRFEHGFKGYDNMSDGELALEWREISEHWNDTEQERMYDVA